MIAKKVTVIYLYKLGASEKDERPPKIHTLPTTNQTAKKQSSAILKWSTNAWILTFFYCNLWVLEQIAIKLWSSNVSEHLQIQTISQLYVV